ncbi:lipid A Biosynthesis domain protein [Acetomicrobium hydrogeniformans ATCC BAA-1850]|uniref:Lipid A Biosynthesis domain protein n=2 Tax=Acetomicrobium hydrogeniformans TaxID=649746 RepID=A0A0T5X9Q6_9BACT|nr:lipid A Biosynthesis domain protein [Acetomicrobium hydrogeniformans ATCC BAA-1850]
MHMNGLLILGFVAQGLFGARFFVQWLASEKEKRSVVPFSFWILSLVGGILLFIYATARHDPVFMVGQASGVFIYIRNIYFILRERKEIVHAK